MGQGTGVCEQRDGRPGRDRYGMAGQRWPGRSTEGHIRQGSSGRDREGQAGTGMAGQRWPGRGREGHTGQGRSGRDREGQAETNTKEKTETVLWGRNCYGYQSNIFRPAV